MRQLLLLLCTSTLLDLCVALPSALLTPSTSHLSQPEDAQFPYLNIRSSTGINTPTSHITTWPSRLPFRYALPDHKSTYFILSSYTIPEPQPPSDLVLSTIITLVQQLSREGDSGDTFTSIRLQAAAPVNVTWEFERELPFSIDRQTAILVLNAVANMEVKYGTANLRNVLFQQDMRFYGTFNLTIEPSPEATLPLNEETQPVYIATS